MFGNLSHHVSDIYLMCIMRAFLCYLCCVKADCGAALTSTAQLF